MRNSVMVNMNAMGMMVVCDGGDHDGDWSGFVCCEDDINISFKKV